MKIIDQLKDRLQLRQWLMPAVSEKDREEINHINSKLVGRAVWIFGGVAAALFLFFVAIYAASFREHRTALFGMGCCAAMLGILILISTGWARDPNAASGKKTMAGLEIFYWLFSAWGIWLSLALYKQGHQMMILDTVQIAFALLVCTYPIWAVVRTTIVYLILLILLYKADGAAHINVVNYCVLEAMICFGSVIRYGMELRNVQQMRVLRQRARTMEDTSKHDTLTGMKNRAALREDFLSFCGENLWVVMADVDHFKKYNDTYGHDTGDRILQMFAGTIHALFGNASTYRYGGDEFLIILQGMSRSEVTMLLMVWAGEIRKLHLEEIPDESFRCSYGFTGGKPESEEELRGMITKADKKLYEMKRARAT